MNARRRYVWNVKEPSERVEANSSTAARMPFTCEAHLIYAPDNISNLYTHQNIEHMHIGVAASYVGIMIGLWIAVLLGVQDHISQDKVRTSKRWPLDFSRGKPVSTPILYCGNAQPKGIYDTSSHLVEADTGLCDEIATWSFAHFFIIYQLVPVALLWVQQDWNGLTAASFFCVLRFAWYTWTDEAVGVSVDASDHVLINGFIVWLAAMTAIRLYMADEPKLKLKCGKTEILGLATLGILYAIFAAVVFPWSTYITGKIFHTDEEMNLGFNATFYVLLAFTGLAIFLDKQWPMKKEDPRGAYGSVGQKTDDRLPVHY